MTATPGARLELDAPDDDTAFSAVAVRERFSDGRVLVIGDLMLDRYVHGAVERVSPEAPVPVLRVERESARPGGAGNVAANLAGLGLGVSVAGCVGDDEAGIRLRRALEGLGASCEAVLTLPGRPTTVKTRVIGGAQQMLRLDVEETGPIDAGTREELLRLLGTADHDAEVVVMSDYAKGMLGGDRIAAQLVRTFRDRGVPVLVDAKGHHLRRYVGATAITPNRGELAQAAHLGEQDSPALFAAAVRFREELQLEFLLLTLGADGMILVDEAGSEHLPSRAREVYDVSGAGDTVVATLAAGLAAGLAPLGAARLANLAAGIVVGKVGTAPVGREELLTALAGEPAAGEEAPPAAGSVEWASGCADEASGPRDR